MNTSSSSRLFRPVASRLFSSAPVRAAEPSASKRPPTRRQPLRDYNLRNLEEYQFDDATSLGYMRLEKIREALEIVRRVDVDRAALQGQRKPFKPPISGIRISQSIDLSDPDSLVHRKRVLLAPVNSLPLKTHEATHRFKLLAGSRWTPGQPGRKEASSDANQSDGWVKLSEEAYSDGRTNRSSVSQKLERLVASANDPSSPLPADSPLDPRHLLARQSKKSKRDASHLLRRAKALQARPEVIGGVRGFPQEWL